MNECKDEEEKENHATDDVVAGAILCERELRKNKGRKMSAVRRKTVIPSVIQLFIYFDVEQGALIQKVNIHKPWRGVERIYWVVPSMRCSSGATLFACFIVGTFSSSSSDFKR